MTIASKAFSKIKDYDKYTIALEKRETELKNNYGATPRSNIIDSFVEYALNDEPFPSDVVTAQDEHDRAVHNVTARRKLLKDASAQLSRLRTETVQDHGDTALLYLRDELEKVVEEVRSISRLVAKTATAEDILRNADEKQMKAWKRVDSLIQRYDVIRNTQKEIVRFALRTDDLHKFFEAGVFRNSLDCSPFWHQERSRSYSPRARDDQDESVRNYNEWLVSYTASRYGVTGGIWPSKDRKAYLLDICTATELWVPTIKELALAHKAASTAALPVDKSKLKETEEARDQFYAITRTEPTTPYKRSKSAGAPAPRRSDRQKAAINALLKR